MINRKRLSFILFLSVFSASTQGMTSPNDSAEQLFRSATQTQDLNRRLQLLNESIATDPTFEAWYMKGLTLQEMKQYDESLEALSQSRVYANDDSYSALALGRSAQVLADQGHGLEGLALIRKAVQTHQDPPDWMQAFLLDLNTQYAAQPIPANQIAQALSSRSVRAFGVQPSVDLYVTFAWNRHDLDQHGRSQLDELSSALASLHTQGDSYQIIGHTDSTGDEKYNLRLSEQRAATVQRELALALGPRSPTLCIQGKGEEAMLYNPDETKDKQRLNRRVEIKAVSTCR